MPKDYKGGKKAGAGASVKDAGGARKTPVIKKGS